MKLVILSFVIAAIGLGMVLTSYLNAGATAQKPIVAGLVLLIIGCFGLVLLYPEPPQARCAPPLRSSIL